jgi:Leucine-rich repeat (LRR) protein
MLMVKLGVASMTGKLDLTDCRLPFLPPDVFDIGSDLEELCLAGNMITELPRGIGKLTGLKRLQLAGNFLRSIPPEIGELSSLEGLWLGGNMIEGELPTEIGNLTNLKQLSVSGNCIETLPSSMGSLISLVELEVAGNDLSSIPHEIYKLKNLKKLCLNGNRITHLPESGVEGLESLEELFLMGNILDSLPPGIGRLKNLKQLSVADNMLRTLPMDILTPGLGSDHKPSLQKLWAYGNGLVGLDSIRGLLDASSSSLDSLWLEGNPLGPQASEALLTLGIRDKALPNLKALGLDLSQLQGVKEEAILAVGYKLKAGEVIRPPVLSPTPTGQQKRHHGYFKLVPSPTSEEGQSNLSSSKAKRLISPKPVLLVSFGSAPGTPNWGGLVGKLYKEAKEERDRAFDVLYIVDPSRSWYQGGCCDDSFDYYRDRLKEYTSRYRRVVMVGDSMGATAALLFADLATTVLAFCPQVDLSTASIRPGGSSDWFDRLKARLLSVLEGLPSSTSVTSFVGTWQHDLDQVNLLPEREEDVKATVKEKAAASDVVVGQSVKKGGIRVKVFSLDSHRLALYLDKQNKLLPMVRDAIAHEQGERTGNIRIANLL